MFAEAHESADGSRPKGSLFFCGAKCIHWPISTNWMEPIVGSYLGVLLTQLPPTAFAPPWIMQNTLCLNAFVISWVAVELEWGSRSSVLRARTSRASPNLHST